MITALKVAGAVVGLVFLLMWVVAIFDLANEYDDWLEGKR